MRLSLSFALSIITSVLAGPACAPLDQEEPASASEDELRALSADEVIGSLRYGETRTVGFASGPGYRAFAFEGREGDAVEAWVSSPIGDARAWLLGPSFKTYARNDDAEPGLRHARVRVTLRQTGTHYVAFREASQRSGKVTVSLRRLCGEVDCPPSAAAVPTWETSDDRPMGELVFDAVRSRLVVLTSTGTSERKPWGWSEPSGDPLPSTRGPAPLAYDSERGRVVLYQGDTATTWEWDGNTNVWAKASTSRIAPPRGPGLLAYDAKRKQTVFHAAYSPSRETWTWDGSSWTPLPVGVGRPNGDSPIVYSASMAYDPVRERIVLFTVYGAVGHAASTWEWDGRQWSKAADGGGLSIPGFTVHRSNPPAPTVFDLHRGRLVRVGFAQARPLGLSLGLLDWTGSTWAPFGIKGPDTQHEFPAYTAAYDTSRNRLVIGDRYSRKTFEYVLLSDARER